MKKITQKVNYIFIIALVVFFDMFTKNLAVLKLRDSGAMSIDVIKGVFAFTYHENRGAAWGMLADHRWVFMIFSTIAIIAIISYLFISNASSKLFSYSLALIAGGGIGNMIDRISLGYVIDFLNFSLIDFPIFNVADSFITIGAGLLIIYLFIPEKKERQGK